MRSLISQIVAPRCPACDNGKLFKDSLSIVDRCAACGHEWKSHDAADGPAYFTICVVGIGVMILVSYVEIMYEPPLWLHAALWLPFILLSSLVSLRVFKTLMITIEYRIHERHRKQTHD